MPRSHTQMLKVFNRQFDLIDKEQAKSFAIGGIESGAIESPGPDKTPLTSTGRARMSLSVSSGSLKRFDPGLLASYKIPNKSSAKRGLIGRSVGDDVFISIGVEYGAFLEKWGYLIMEAAQRGGLMQLQADQSRLMARVARV